MGKSSPLHELIDLNELQSIQNSFASAVGTSSVIFSPEGVAVSVLLFNQQRKGNAAVLHRSWIWLERHSSKKLKRKPIMIDWRAPQRLLKH